MPTVKQYLQLALTAMDAERDHLLQALQLATASNYNHRLTTAIDKALRTNHEAELHLSNLIAAIHHPAAPPYHLKPGMFHPRRS